MAKGKRRLISHDGCLRSGGPAPAWTEDAKDSQKSYGQRQSKRLIAQQNAYWDGILEDEISHRQIAVKESMKKQISQIKENVRKQEARKLRTNPGPKYKLNDEQGLQIRRDAKTKSLSSIALEYNVSRRTIENCVKGITFKHLNFLCPPQL